MRSILILTFFTLALDLNAQGLEMTIEINQTVLKKNSAESDDSLKITCMIKNTGNESAFFRFSWQYFMLEQIDNNEGSVSHCFNVYPADFSKIYDDYFERSRDSFIKLEAGEVINYSGYYSVSWLCRGAPPRGDWELKMRYYRKITESDNYYLIKSYYTDKPDTLFVKDAWTGELSTNYVSFVMK